MTIAIIFNEKIIKYDFGEGHPFRGDRFINFMNLFKNLGLHKDPRFTIIKGIDASDEDILLVHDQEYINEVYTLAKYRSFLTPDTPLNMEIIEGAKAIVGSSMLAGKIVMENSKIKIAEGIGGGLHHAAIDRGGGFCIFNDVAICAKMLIKKYGLKKILIIDTDAHAADGTMDIFYDDPKVLLISIHQDPRTLYPGRGFIYEFGIGEGEGYKINIPIPPYAGDECYKIVLEEIFKPIAEEYRPEIIIRNGGSDPHWADQLTNLCLTLKGFRMIGETIKEVSEKVCNGKVVDLCGSGYNPKVLPYAWLSIILGLSGIEIPIEEPLEIPNWVHEKSILKIEETKNVIKEVKNTFKKYWKCFK
jgi:acetoin utilization protein AcuC